jgi:hypothetical protein
MKGNFQVRFLEGGGLATARFHSAKVCRRWKEITETWLARQLRPYGVRPKTIWIGETSAKGYLEADFEETFRRYIPKAAIMAYLAQAKEAQQGRPAEKRKESEGARLRAGAPNR